MGPETSEPGADRGTGTGAGAEVVVVAGGGPVEASLVGDLSGRRVIAADSGAELALGLGLDVTELVGDLDSVAPAVLSRLESAGVAIERHPRDKDATDLVLALDRAAGTGASSVLVIAGSGGRLDHVLANALVLGSDRFAAMEIDAVFGETRVHVVRAARRWWGEPGDVVSLLAVGGPARGLHTDGLRFALVDGELEPGSSRGLSNEHLVDAAGLRVGSGTVLVVRPGAQG